MRGLTLISFVLGAVMMAAPFVLPKLGVGAPIQMFASDRPSAEPVVAPVIVDPTGGGPTEIDAVSKASETPGTAVIDVAKPTETAGASPPAGKVSAFCKAMAAIGAGSTTACSPEISPTAVEKQFDDVNAALQENAPQPAAGGVAPAPGEASKTSGGIAKPVPKLVSGAKIGGGAKFLRPGD